MEIDQSQKIAVIGAGLAGCEAAYALARRGIPVTLFEMKPEKFSPAHRLPGPAELVCSNSFRSDAPEAAVGVLKAEMRDLGSLVMTCAELTRVPAGAALAVDRTLFSAEVERVLSSEANIRRVNREIHSLDDPALAEFAAVILAAGPLCSDALAASLARATGSEHLYFYDAIAPSVERDSLDDSVIFFASRFEQDDAAYGNIPLSKEAYLAFREALLRAEKVKPREFEAEVHFEGCMPIEALAERGEDTLAFGSFKPVGLIDPRTGRRPYAVVQLRPENRDKTVYGLVGCQTKLTYPEQKRVFRTLPGMAGAEFSRLGSMHRNTYVDAPKCLNPDLSLKNRPNVFLAGQISGVEGYVESAAMGLWLGIALAARLRGRALPDPPETCMFGGLLAHLRTGLMRPDRFQPANIQYGLVPALAQKAGSKKRKALFAERARADFSGWLDENRESIRS